MNSQQPNNNGPEERARNAAGQGGQGINGTGQESGPVSVIRQSVMEIRAGIAAAALAIDGAINLIETHCENCPVLDIDNDELPQAVSLLRKVKASLS
jgi:hypothetical protein